MGRQLKIGFGADPRREIVGAVGQKQKDELERALAEMMAACFEMIKSKEAAR